MRSFYLPKTKTLLSFIFMNTTSVKNKVIKKPLPIDRVLHPFREFAEKEASGGIVLIFCLVAALAWANSPWASSYNNFWHTELTISFGSFTLSKSLLHWINDGLMALFFFVIGLEIKRELLVGELSSRRKAILPIAAALGGMIIPAIFFIAINAGKATASGWGIPMATDIAFALGILALLGSRVPTSLKVFLTALAIVDDIGAVIIIALFYTEKLILANLGVGLVILLILIVANRLHVRHPLPYAILGIFLWLAFLKSGLHATLAGIIVALTIPAKTRINTENFLRRSEELTEDFASAIKRGKNILINNAQQVAVHEQKVVCRQAETPLQRMEHTLLPWIAFVIMPLFALANAGVVLNIGQLSSDFTLITLGMIAGLVFGKPIGIVTFTWIAIKSGLADKPSNITWQHIIGVGFLAGIGFTMSLFIASLAFGDNGLLPMAKIGILLASLLAGITGYLILRKSKSVALD